MKTLQKRKFTFSDYWDKYSTITILVIMIAVFGALRPSSFLTGSNLIKIMEQSAITILLGLGEFFAILLGGIDLSVSSTMALSGALTAQLMVNGGLHPLLAIFLGVLVFGAAIGMVNGFLVTATGLPPFIITLGTQAILRSLVYIITDARAVSGLPASFSKTMGGKLFDFIPVPILVAVVTAHPHVLHGQAAGRAQPVRAGRKLSVCLVCGHHGKKAHHPRLCHFRRVRGAGRHGEHRPPCRGRTQCGHRL